MTMPMKGRMVRAGVALAMAAAPVPRAAAQEPGCQEVATVGDRCPDWIATYDGEAGGAAFMSVDVPAAVAVAPGGGPVFVTGRGNANQTGSDIVTVAYDPATGAERWVASHAGPGKADDRATDVAVSSDGSSVFVAGVENRSNARNVRSVTIAYDAATGAIRWLSTQSGVASYEDTVRVGVSPDAERVYVATRERASEGTTGLVVRALDAATGSEVWSGRHPAADKVLKPSLAVSPDGRRVFVGATEGYDSEQGADYLVTAFGADEAGQAGELLWTARYDGPYTNDLLHAMAMAPDGSAVYATGESEGPWRNDAATVAFGAEDGATLWVSRFETVGWDAGHAVAVSPDGSRVYVAGVADDQDQMLLSAFLISSQDALVVAYDAATGEQDWFDLAGVPGFLDERAVAVGVSAGGTVHAAGYSAATFNGQQGPSGGGGGSFDSKGNSYSHSFNTGNATVVTLAYSPEGEREWVARQAAPPGGNTAYAVALAHPGDGSDVFVAAARFQPYADSEHQETSNLADFLTLGFRS
jgi:hypothetical protein